MSQSGHLVGSKNQCEKREKYNSNPNFTIADVFMSLRDIWWVA